MEGRELHLELTVTAGFLAVCAILIAAAPGLELNPVAFAAVVAYAIAANVTFPVGAGHAVPTQLFLVPLFVLASAELVPVLIFVALILSNLIAAIAGRGGIDRVVTAGGDAIHAVGPALVIIAFASGEGATATPWVIGLAFCAQLGFDYLSSWIHDVVVFRVRPELHLRVLAQVWSVDAALLPFALLVAAAEQETAWATLAPLPLVVLLERLAADRQKRIAVAHERLEQLALERRKHQGAIDRLGESLAVRLDLDALLEVVTEGATEALSGSASRGMVLEREGLGITPVVSSGDIANLGGSLRQAEDEALRAAQLAVVDEDETHAMASLIGGPRDPIGLISLARATPYSNEERSLLTRLCQQAAVSFDEALQHERLRAAEARLRHQAHHDQLTGLGNRAMFIDRLMLAMAEHEQRPRKVAVLFMDLDGFKLANDMLGHEAGDELLAEIGARISRCIRPGDIAARIGGDEFTMMLEGLGASEEAGVVAERLLRSISEPIVVKARKVVVHASIGIAFSDLGIAPAELLSNADMAMYAAKRAGGNVALTFNGQMLDTATTQAQLATDLPRAIENGEFEVHFQPIVDLGSDELYAAEALVRWRNKSLGLLKPRDFVGAAEHTGTISGLGRFVLDRACQFVSEQEHGPKRVSVNVSPMQLRDPDLVAEVAASIRRHGIAPDKLIIEITESMAVGDDPATRVNMQELQSLGVILALDDFGTGYSSLSHLAQLPIDIVKLDRAFMGEIDGDPGQARFVGGVAALAQSLGLSVIAEGIERPSQLECVRDLGINLGQGYLLAEPMEAGSMVTWLDFRALDQSLGTPHPAATNGSH